MRHLHPDELIDLAEGTRPVSSAPHLQQCDVCRTQLADLRLVMNAARDVEVPEPSPLYWDHLSARVRGAVAAEGVPGTPGWVERWSWSWSRVGAPLRTASAGAIAAIVLIAALTVTRLARAPHDASGPLNPDDLVANSGASIDPSAPDSSLDLVADLTENMDWDTAREGGFAPRQDAVERAVGEMTDVERRELRRLLKEELAKSN